MNAQSHRIVPILLCFLIFIVPLQAQSLRYVYTEYYPANYLDVNGNPAGFFVEIITEALTNRMGIPVEIEVFPWRRCQTLVQNGSADMITTIPTAERCSYSVSTNTPLWIKRYHIYTRKDHPETGTMNSISSIPEIALHKFSVISYLGNSWSQDNLEQRGVPVIYATSVEGMYRMLTAKRGDILIDDPVLVDPALKDLGYENTIIMISDVVAESTFHPMLGKKSIYLDRVDELDATLGEMWKDGTIEQILETYRTR